MLYFYPENNNNNNFAVNAKTVNNTGTVTEYCPYDNYSVSSIVQEPVVWLGMWYNIKKIITNMRSNKSITRSDTQYNMKCILTLLIKECNNNIIIIHRKAVYHYVEVALFSCFYKTLFVFTNSCWIKRVWVSFTITLILPCTAKVLKLRNVIKFPEDCEQRYELAQ